MSTAKANAPGHSTAGVLPAGFAVWLVPIAIFTLGAASALLYFWGRDLHRFTQWVSAYLSLFIGQLAMYLAACYVVVRWSDRSSRTGRWVILGLIIVFAIGFRAMLVPQRPYLSTDVYRYIWDGHVQAAGINPYRYVPNDPALSGLRDDRIYPNISGGYHNWLSPYPPVAQAIFLGISLIRPLSVSAFKAVMAAFDLIAVILVMMALARSGADPARAIIFAWHPLLIFEGAHSGHIEAAFVAFLVLALLACSRRRFALTGIALALATLVKFYPVLIVPAFLVTRPDDFTAAPGTREPLSSPAGFTGLLSRAANRHNLSLLAAFVATLVFAYIPYIGAGRNLFGYLDEYIKEEGFTHDGARYFPLSMIRMLFPIPAEAFLLIAAVCLVGVSAWWAIRVKRDAFDVARGATVLIGLYLILTTPRYAWYYVWLIPFLCFIPRISWLYLTSAAALLYLVWYTPLVYPEIPIWLGACIYVPALALLAWEYLTPDRRDTLTSGIPRSTG
jgi:alpha-1,6-mannosyltransferase